MYMYHSRQRISARWKEREGRLLLSLAQPQPQPQPQPALSSLDQTELHPGVAGNGPEGAAFNSFSAFKWSQDRHSTEKAGLDLEI